MSSSVRGTIPCCLFSEWTRLFDTSAHLVNVYVFHGVPAQRWRIQVHHGGLKHGIQASENRYGKDHVPVLARDIEITEEVVCDSPDEVGNLAQLGILHA